MVGHLAFCPIDQPKPLGTPGGLLLARHGPKNTPKWAPAVSDGANLPQGGQKCQKCCMCMLRPPHTHPLCSDLQHLQCMAPLCINTQGSNNCLAPHSCIFARFAMPTSIFVPSWQVKNGPQNTNFIELLSISMCLALHCWHIKCL